MGKLGDDDALGPVQLVGVGKEEAEAEGDDGLGKWRWWQRLMGKLSLLVDVGSWATKRACHWKARHQEKGTSPGRFR